MSSPWNVPSSFNELSDIRLSVIATCLQNQHKHWDKCCTAVDILKRLELLAKQAEKFPLCSSIGLLMSPIDVDWPNVKKFIPWESIENSPWGERIKKEMEHQGCHLEGPWIEDVENCLRMLLTSQPHKG